MDQKKIDSLRQRIEREPVSGQALKNAYDQYAVPALIGTYVEGAEPRYRLVEGKTLPANEAEYRALLAERFTQTVDSIVEDAYQMIEELAGEAREVYDNMESGNLGSTQRCQTFGETAEALEGVSTPDLPDTLSQITALRYPDITKKTSRAHRAAEAAADLNLAADAIDEWIDDKREMLDERDDDDNEAVEEELGLDDLEALAETLREDAATLEGVEFPGMFG